MKRLLLLVFVVLLVAGCGKKQVPTRPDVVKRPEQQKRQPVAAAPAPTPAMEQKPGPVPKGTFKPYTINGKKYYPLSTANGYVETGIASWYGRDFHGLKTANGETYDMYAMTAAHKILPMNTYIRLTRMDDGRQVTLRVNDRGPFVGSRIVDVTHTAAKALGMIGPGTAMVRLEVVGTAGSQPTSIAKAIASGRYYVQVGSFRFRDNADRLVKELRAKGYGGSRVRQARISGATYYRVQAGAFDGMDRAKRAHAVLNEKYPSSFLIAD